MKRSTLATLTAILGFSFALTSVSFAGTVTEEVKGFARKLDQSPKASKEEVGSITGALVTGSFDKDADAIVVVNGALINSCHHYKEAQVDHIDGLTHEIRAIETIDQGGPCIQAIFHFMKEVNLGKLESGKHTLKFVSRDGTYFEKSLTVE
jgi:hypothetical protein